MIDINDKSILKQLKDICKTQSGKVLIEYLRYCVSKHSYDTISSDRTIQDIGHQFLVKREVQNELNEIIKFLTSE